MVLLLFAIIFQSVIQSFLKTPVCGASLSYQDQKIFIGNELKVPQVQLL